MDFSCHCTVFSRCTPCHHLHATQADMKVASMLHPCLLWLLHLMLDSVGCITAILEHPCRKIVWSDVMHKKNTEDQHRTNVQIANNYCQVVYNRLQNKSTYSHLGARYCAKRRELFSQTFVINSIIEILYIQVDTLKKRAKSIINHVWKKRNTSASGYWFVCRTNLSPGST